MDKDVLLQVGKRIALYRKLKNLTQAQLSQMIGTTQTVLSNWEKGKYDPGSDNLIQICNALEISPVDLLTNKSPDTFQIIVDTETMEPYIRKGDVLTVNGNASIRDGDTVLVDTPHETGLIRRLFRTGIQLLLLSANPTIPPIRTDKSNVKIKGKVTDIHRKL